MRASQTTRHADHLSAVQIGCAVGRKGLETQTRRITDFVDQRIATVDLHPQIPAIRPARVMHPQIIWHIARDGDAGRRIQVAGADRAVAGIARRQTRTGRLQLAPAACQRQSPYRIDAAQFRHQRLAPRQPHARIGIVQPQPCGMTVSDLRPDRQTTGHPRRDGHLAAPWRREKGGQRIAQTANRPRHQIEPQHRSVPGDQLRGRPACQHAHGPQ